MSDRAGLPEPEFTREQLHEGIANAIREGDMQAAMDILQVMGAYWPNDAERVLDVLKIGVAARKAVLGVE